MDSKTVFPIQPIVDHRFVENKIVSRLLDEGGIDMNDIACWDIPQQDRIQFAQLIGYSVSGFGSLSYVDDETYDAAEQIAENGCSEDEAQFRASITVEVTAITTAMLATVDANNKRILLDLKGAGLLN